jgi:hypothetical protein
VSPEPLSRKRPLLWSVEVLDEKGNMVARVTNED